MAADMIEQSGTQNAVMCLDPYHFFRTGHKPADLKKYDSALLPYTQIDDGGDNVPAPGGRCAPGEGKVPLAEIFDILPANLPLSLEWGPPRDSGYSAAEWAKIALDTTRKYMDGYHASKKN
jgi:sugar phosphate isomerase/epimerase